MKIEYIAYDSFGIKSMCTLVETDDCCIVIDPGISIETGSYPLPLPLKLFLIEKYRGKIKKGAKDADICIVTHYHWDHHLSSRIPSLYGKNFLFIKDPKNFINKSQRSRAASFLEKIEGLPKKIEIADGKQFRIGKTRIKFSKPLWHGVVRTNLGYIVMVEIFDGKERLLYTSDVDGPILEESTNLIIEDRPDIIILDGPPTYLLGYLHAYYNLARSIINVCRILEETPAKTIVLDHHLIRDYRYPDLMFLAYEKARAIGKKLCTAAELIGENVKVLDAYQKYGPTKWKRWRRFERKDAIAVLENAIENKLIEEKWLYLFEKYV